MNYEFKPQDICKSIGLLMASQFALWFITLSQQQSQVFSTMIFAVLFLSSILLMLLINENPYEFKQDLKIKNVLFVVFITIFTMVLLSVLQSIFVHNITETENQKSLNTLIDMRYTLMCIHTMLFAPILEECIFRHLLVKPGKLLKFRYVISTILFVLLHCIGDLSSITEYILPTLLFVFIRIKTGSVKYSITSHITYNSVLMLLYSL